jgi:hypothetical protein
MGLHASRPARAFTHVLLALNFSISFVILWARRGVEARLAIHWHHDAWGSHISQSPVYWQHKVSIRVDGMGSVRKTKISCIRFWFGGSSLF